jgi:hypothetical protein
MRAANLCWLVAALAMALVQGCASEDDPELANIQSAATVVPTYDHVVIVLMENTDYSAIKDNASAPYVNSLMAQGASFTSSHGVTHPSQPNYIALFSGSTQGVTSDSCPRSFNAPNLGNQLLAAGYTITAYSEDLPSVGYTGCSSGKYARKHAPWADFTNFPHTNEKPFTAFPSSAAYATLPTVSFVVPNLCNDMHDCSMATGDTWLRTRLDAYVQWAKTHNSLLILTWDEDDFTTANQIPTVFVGAMVRPGDYGQNINHYSVLHTVESMFGLAALGNAAAPITDVWTSTAPGDDFSLGLSPAALTVAQGAAASTALGTTVLSGNPQTATLSATGAPSGATVSFSPASITTGASATVTVAAGASTVPGSYTVTVTATGSGATHTASLSLTVTSTGGGGPAIVNGDFETGSLAGWTGTGSTSVSTVAHGGAASARVGSDNPSTDSTLVQSFTAPTGGTRLTFWYQVTCPDTVQYDWATARLKDTTSGTTTTVLAKTCTNDGVWRKATATITPGHSYTLTLTSHDDDYAGDATFTRFDDVAVGAP